jgi:hypothetical protein
MGPLRCGPIDGGDEVRVAVCEPAYRQVDPECAFSIMNVVLHSRDKIISFRSPKDMYIDKARNDLVRYALKDEVSHALFLDDDMVFPPELLEKLLYHCKTVVGAMYFRKMPPHETVCGDFVDGLKVQPLGLLNGSLQRVGCLGMGATLVEVGVLHAMARKFGDELWFRSQECGEDVWFFDRLRQMGVPAYVDGSLVCGHCVTQLVTDEHWRAYHK